FFNSSQGPQHREFRKEILQAMQVGDGPQQRGIGFPISTDNASWRGPNIEAGGKSAYNNVQVGVGQRNKFCENIISVPLPRLFWIMLHHLNDFRQFL
ncbi:hypothetical protein, partial [Staphylococcus aureus]|uniref:hypothetical protein n=1 Tax=Staphylococcus aureus TaxID=1280 RepID=UPI001CD7CD40